MIKEPLGTINNVEELKTALLVGYSEEHTGLIIQLILSQFTFMNGTFLTLDY